MSSFQAHSKTSLVERFNTAKQCLEVLSDLDSLSETKVHSHLNKICGLLKDDERAAPLRDAIVASIYALQIPFSDPILIRWTSWTARLPWIRREMELLEGTIHDLPVSNLIVSELNEYRKTFEREDDGWPTDSTCNGIRHRELRRCHIADSRLTTLEDSAGQLTALKAEDMYHELSKLQISQSADLIKKLSVKYYRSIDGIPNQIFESHDNIMQSWQRRSPSFAIFSSEDLKNTMKHSTFSTISAILFDGELLHYGLTLFGRESFLPQTPDKLSKLSSVILPDDINLYSWQYFSVGNPRLQTLLAQYHVDWYKMYQEVLGDEVIHRGKEVVLGIVESNNPAVKSHIRVGYQYLPTKIVFRSDNGEESRLTSYSVFE